MSNSKPQCWNCDALVILDDLEIDPKCPYCGADLSNYLHQVHVIDEYETRELTAASEPFHSSVEPGPCMYYLIMVVAALLWVFFHELAYGGVWP